MVGVGAQPLGPFPGSDCCLPVELAGSHVDLVGVVAEPSRGLSVLELADGLGGVAFVPDLLDRGCTDLFATFLADLLATLPFLPFPLLLGDAQLELADEDGKLVFQWRPGSSLSRNKSVAPQPVVTVTVNRPEGANALLATVLDVWPR